MNNHSISCLPWLPKQGRQMLLVGALCLIALSFSAFSFAPSAHAATLNSKEVAVGTNSISVNSFWIDGRNQNNQQVGTCMSYQLGIQNGFELLPNWWWAANTSIRVVEYSDTNCTYPGNFLCQDFHFIPSNASNPFNVNAKTGSCSNVF